MFFSFPIGWSLQSLAILLAALLLDAVFGGRPEIWRIIPHPVRQIGWAIDRLDRGLNRARCSPGGRRWRGCMTAVGLTAVAAGLGMLVTALRQRWHWGFLVEIFLVTALVAQRSLFDHVRAVATALRQDGLAGGRRAVAKIVGRDTAGLDEHGVARAAIESCAESLADGIVAPVFWYMLLGLPGLLAVKTVNTMDSMIGHKNEHYRDFGMVAARADDVMIFIPARLAGLLICAAACFVPRGRPWHACKVMGRDHAKHTSPNAGWPESAMAGALDLTLAGPRRYGTETVAAPWIGDGRAKATAADIKRSLYVLSVACLIEFGMIVLLLVAHR